MSKRDNFVFYASWLDALSGLDETNSREFANEFLRQIVIYGVTGEIETDNPMIVGFINAMCKDLLDKWGMDVPVTIADWEEVFAKAKVKL